MSMVAPEKQANTASAGSELHVIQDVLATLALALARVVTRGLVVTQVGRMSSRS
jgi:hypothetical protein